MKPIILEDTFDPPLRVLPAGELLCHNRQDVHLVLEYPLPIPVPHQPQVPSHFLALLHLGLCELDHPIDC